MSDNKEPFSSCTGHGSVDGVETDLFICDYSDKVMIVVTQFEKLGTMVLCQRDRTISSAGPDDKETFSVRPLLGEENEGMLVYARHLVESLQKKGIVKPILLSLALKQYAPQGLRPFVDLITSHCQTISSASADT